MSVSIGEVMTKSPHTLGEEQTVEVAKRFMYQHGIRHLPILHGGECVGVISDRDIKLAYAVEPDAGKLLLKDVCNGEVYGVSPDAKLKEVAKQMLDRGIGSAIVMEGAKVIGIFTVTDACRIIAQAS